MAKVIAGVKISGSIEASGVASAFSPILNFSQWKYCLTVLIKLMFALILPFALLWVTDNYLLGPDFEISVLSNHVYKPGDNVLIYSV